VRGHSGLGIGARWSGGGVVGGGDAEVPFYRVGGGEGRPGDEGELAAAVEAAVSGGDRPGRWWGVLGGVL
jgi:hypothetical protein